jgi:hypothetical protein
MYGGGVEINLDGWIHDHKMDKVFFAPSMNYGMEWGVTWFGEWNVSFMN